MKVAVFGATGPIGRAVTPGIRERGHEVRVVSRNEEKLRRDFEADGAEIHPADVADPEETIQAADGCDVVIHSVGLPAPEFDAHIRHARSTVQACEEVGARPFLVTSYWSYGPGDPEPMAEDRTRRGDGEMSRIRARQEDVFLEAGGAVARLPDFYGPDDGLSVLNDALDAVRTDDRVLWPGDPDAPRDFLYYDDAGGILSELALRDDAYGRPWNVPGSGAVPPREILRIATRYLDRSVRVRGVGKWMARIAALFRSDVREFLDVLPLYRAPLILDTSRIESLLGPESVQTTPYEEAIPVTLDWLAGR